MGRTAKWKSAGQGDLNRLAKLLGASEQGLEFKDYDEDAHPRDDHGRFSSGGGGGSAKDRADKIAGAEASAAGPPSLERAQQYAAAAAEHNAAHPEDQVHGHILEAVDAKLNGRDIGTGGQGGKTSQGAEYDAEHTFTSQSAALGHFDQNFTTPGDRLLAHTDGDHLLLERANDGHTVIHYADTARERSMNMPRGQSDEWLRQQGFKKSALDAYVQFKAGNESALLDYWGGDGDIGSTGGFDRCVTALSGKDDIDDPEALCAWVHHEVTGEWPGKKGEDVSDMEMKREVVVPEGMTGLGYKVLDEELGIVETIVSVTGIVDRVNDNILPGAYEKTLIARKPKGVWSHDWEQPISKTRKIEELKPGDPRLPTETKSGDPWPSGAGAVLVTTQFNLNTTLGRDAFESVKFFGDEQEWSIGYKVPVGKSRVDRKTGVREIQEMDLFEYSPVLFGAMPLATSLSSKSSDPHGGLAEPAMVAATVVSALLGHIDAAHGSHDLFARALGELTVIGNGGWSSDAQVSCRAAAAAASAVANASSGKMQRDALQAASAFRMIADALEAADVEDLSMSGKAEDTESKDIASPAASVTGQAPAPHASMVPNRPMGVSGTQVSAAARVMDQGQTPSTGSVPLGANDAGSQAPAPNGDLGRANTGGATNGQAPAPDGHDGAPASNGQWQVAHQYVDDGQGRCVRCGRSLGFDLHTGWSPGSMNRQQAADTLATEAGNTAQGSGAVDSGNARTVPTSTDVNTMITGNKRYDVYGWEAKIDVPMSGSYEEMQRQLKDQANVVLRALDRTEDQDDPDESAEGVMTDYVCLEATFPDHIIASYTDYDDSPMTRYFTIPWMRDTDGSPKLGTPAEVNVAAVLTAKIDPHQVAEIITEVKAGRVLSAANMEKLRAAHGHLGTVLDSANAKKPDGDGMDDEGDGDDDTKKKADDSMDAQLMEFEALRAGLLVSD